VLGRGECIEWLCDGAAEGCFQVKCGGRQYKCSVGYLCCLVDRFQRVLLKESSKLHSAIPLLRQRAPVLSCTSRGQRDTATRCTTARLK